MTNAVFSFLKSANVLRAANTRTVRKHCNCHDKWRDISAER